MAITINQQPTGNMPAYNPLVFHVSSTNIAESNFKFIADLYVDGTKVDRLKRSQDPVYSVGVFDVHRIVETYLSYNAGVAYTDGFYKNDESYAVIQVKFGEEYGSSTTGVTVYPDLTNSNSIFVYAGSLKWFDFINYSAATYDLDGITSKFFTNMPTTANIYEDQNQWLSFATDKTNEAFNALVTTYSGANATGSVIQTVSIENLYTDAGTVNDERYLRVVAGWNLNDVAPARLLSGAQPILTASVKSYTILIQDSLGNGVSQTRTFNIYDDCNYWDVYEVLFQNVFGFMETFHFTRKNTKNVTIERKEYKKNVGTLGASSFTFAKSDRGFLSFFTASDEVITMSSGWISEDEATWLEELIESPVVFLNNSGTLEAVTIINTAYERQQVNNNNLINITISVKYSQRNYRQRY